MLTEPRAGSARSSTFKLIAARPAQIDLTTIFEDGSDPLYTKGIYSIQGDDLTYCIAPPGQPRPAELVTQKGDECTLVVLKRAASAAE
jgi:uncharacterized protein (TIGR03067 family)